MKRYKSCAKLKAVKVSALSHECPLEALQGKDSIFLFGNFTEDSRYVADKAKEMRKDGLQLPLWIIDGKIFVTTSPGGKPQRIYCEKDLSNL